MSSDDAERVEPGARGEGSELERAMMGRALAEGVKGRPSPNPHVGAVIARGAELIAVGHHERAGLAHAEVDAIDNANGDTEGATLYCTLEPCNHFGRTSPCTDAILEAKIARVVIGASDPKPHVPGAVQKLRDAGVEVQLGVREVEAKALIVCFSRHITTGLPYVVLKAAVTLDGRIATRDGESRWITSESSRAEAHRLRDRADAVMVGIGTALADDPLLTTRFSGGRDAIRVVIDTHLRLPPASRLASDAGEGTPRTWILHGPEASPARRRALAGGHVELIEIPLDAGHVDLRAALAELGRRDVVRVLAEGGAALHGALLRSGLAQEAAIFVAPTILGDKDAVPLADAGPLDRISDAWRLVDPRVRVFGCDVLFEGRLAGPVEVPGL